MDVLIQICMHFNVQPVVKLCFPASIHFRKWLSKMGFGLFFPQYISRNTAFFKCELNWKRVSEEQYAQNVPSKGGVVHSKFLPMLAWHSTSMDPELHSCRWSSENTAAFQIHCFLSL